MTTNSSISEQKTPPARGPVPGPRGFAGLRAVLEFKRRGLDFLEEMAQQYGPIAAAHCFGFQVYLVSRPDLIEHILVQKRDIYHKANSSVRGRMFFGSPMQLNGAEQAKQQRQMMSGIFRQERIRMFGATIAAASQQMLTQWRAGEQRNVSQEVMALSIDIAIQLHFGTQDAQATEKIRAPFLTVIGLVEDFLALPLWLPTAKNRRFTDAMAALDAEVYRLIQACRKDADANQHSLLAGLVAVKDSAGVGFTDKQIRDELVSMLSAGYLPTALSVNQTLRLLAENPAAEACMAQELASVLQGKAPSADDLSNLPYSTKVVKESLRLCPPAGAMMRINSEPDWIDGWAIPANSKVLISQWVMHHSRDYFDEAEKFKPERWTPEMSSALPNFVYFPFGWGSRACIGQVWGMMEIELILVTILQRFRLDSATPGKHGEMSFTLSAR